MPIGDAIYSFDPFAIDVDIERAGRVGYVEAG